MAYQMAATAVTLNDLEGHSRLQAFSNAMRQTFVQHSTRFQLTVCSHGSSALAELLLSKLQENWFSPDNSFCYFLVAKYLLQKSNSDHI